MPKHSLLALLIGAACVLGATDAAQAYIIIVPPGGTVKVKTPLSKGPVWARIGGTWRRLPEVQKGSQRILRKMYTSRHQIMSGRKKEWLTIAKSGTSTVKLSAAAEAVGQPYTIRLACEVEEMIRGADGGRKYTDARIELQVVVDLPKYLGDFFLGPGDQVSVSIPPTMHVRRVTVLKEKVASAVHQGAAISIAGKEAGHTKATVNYWIGDEVKERFSREIKLEVADPPLEYVCQLQPGESKRVSFKTIGKALKLPDDEGKMSEIKRWVGPATAGVSFDGNALEIRANGKGRSTAVIPFLGAKRSRPFEAWVRVTVACGEEEPTAAKAATPEPAAPEPVTPEPGAEPPAGAEPAEALKILNQFGAPMNSDYLARTKIENTTGSPIELIVTIRFKGKNGDVFGEEMAEGPKVLKPGKKASFKATLKGAGAVVHSFEVLTRILK